MSDTENSLAALERLLNKQEDLDPELVPWLDDAGPFGPALRHPLVYSLIHTPGMNAFANEQLKGKKAALQQAQAEDDWGTYVWLYERPYRLDAFTAISWRLDGPSYWELLGQVYSDTENQWQNRDEWRSALTADPEDRELMSTEDVRCVFELAPELGGLAPRTRIHRGYCFDDALEGFSWTLDRPRARWFANRLRTKDHPPPKIASGFVARENVIAHITSRDEQEIVCLPEDVEELTIETIKEERYE